VLIEPVYIETHRRFVDVVDEEASELLLGRRLSNSELGCAIAHKNALNASLSLMSTRHEVEWVLISEDDSDLDERTLESIARELLGCSLFSPSLVTYYSARGWLGLQILRHIKPGSSPSRARGWSAGAVCYAINRRAVEELAPYLSLPVSYVADWPLYFSHVRRYESKNVKVNEVSGRSTIGDRTTHSVFKRIHTYARQLRNVRKISETYRVPKSIIISRLIVQPIIRDLLNRIF